MNRDLKIAVHAFNEALSRSAEMRDHEMSSWCDHQFDAGEWSDAANARIYEKLFDDLAARVAARFNLDRDFLVNEHRAWCEETMDGTIRPRRSR